MSDVSCHARPSRLGTAVGLHDVERRRAVHCREYDACLDAAVQQQWVSWTCQLCPVFPLVTAPRAADALYGPLVLPA